MFSAEKCRPSSYNGHIYNWNLMLKCPFTSDLENNPEALDELATLLVDLGNTENLNINYEYEKWFSGAYPDRLVPTLKNFGFYNPGKLTTYNVSQAKAEIERGYPVIMNGYPSTGGGHTWILHGVMECHTEMYACNSKGLIVDRWIETSYYFNVNWGWRGNSDGYYLSSGFNAINGPDLDIDAWPPSAYGSNFDGPRTIVIGVRKTNTEI